MRIYTKLPPEIKFWQKVDKEGTIPAHRPELGKCWTWTGSKRIHGHGRFDVKGIGTSAHRFSYHIHNGPIPEGHGVLHKCDNGSCVNPAHLETGTQQDNVDDMISKGRNARGEKRSIIKIKTVLEMRRLYEAGKSIKEIMEIFNLKRGVVSKTVHGKAWKHIPVSDACQTRPNCGETRSQSKFTESDVRWIRSEAAKGRMTYKAMAEKFHVTLSAISSVVNRYTWKHIQ